MAKTDFPIPLFDHSAQPNVGRMPSWVRQSLADGAGYAATAGRIHGLRLHTVCEEARCPNRGECWSRGTATFMLLGDTCTRACGFCAVKTGRPSAPDEGEPTRIVEAAERMGLGYVVLTSVNRDDLPDGGTSLFVATVRALRTRRPATGIELLTPDFRDVQESAVAELTAAGGGSYLVWGHNVETVPSLYRIVRKGAKYERSLRLLELAGAQPAVDTKSALMLGLGESRGEVVQVMRDLRAVGVTRLVLGQYLRPTRFHLPVKEYVCPEAFASYEEEARAAGFAWVKADPMARSSFHAEE